MASYFTDRVVEYPGRIKLTEVSGETDTYDVERAEGTVTQAGTPFNATSFNNIAQQILDRIDTQAARIDELEARDTVKTVTAASSATSIPANAFGAIQIPFTLPTGYKAVGIGQVSLAASGALILFFRVDSQSQLTIGCRNVTSAAVSQTATVTVLCAPITE